MMSNIFIFPLQQQTPSLPTHFLSEAGGYGDFSYHALRQQCSSYGSHGNCSVVVRSSVSEREALQSQSSVVSDKNVPEGHKGLHGFLYGDGDADVHSSDASCLSVTDDGTSVEALDEYLIARDGLKFAGVFSLYNNQHALQYVGFSRNVIVSLRSHVHKFGRETCAFVRVKAYSDSAMITRIRLEEERQKWISMCESPPPGNSVEKDLWEGGIGAAVMSETEKIEYEEKKLKMRKAMGENLRDDVQGEDDDAKTRRLKLLQAVEGDDWSGVIDGQTRETVNGKVLQAVEDKAPPVSPFERNNKEGSSVANGLYSADTFELSVENVDMVLNDVRPYLISDGGNVEVVSVDNGIVSLRLQGACGTCPSSTVTMKMGIERVLKEKFADSLKDVVQVDQQQIGASIQSVNAHLDILRPAIHNYGGSVDVVSVENGECKVKFKGPPPIGMGIQAAVKDKFPEITSVILVDA
ncbi:hypothetical protein GOP47_0022332 [Adiantum capillus-veneris]|uniref:NIF system FeS cluster assembly NifU C-terminal domain-containing protein n=1 Tax=Adiantum capillus-veneris TaxID=13818 RepID=A0A9D4Z458_ADICA|nr:hypothetical protein GOP47_0022332 [Adiantum capillus-veneris]